jgi:hypothetical protein
MYEDKIPNLKPYELVVEDSCSIMSSVGSLYEIAIDYAQKRNHNSEIFIEVFYADSNRHKRVEEDIWQRFCILVNKYERILAIKKSGKDYDA